MKTILATGGLGFIGSHTCIKFLENGYFILIIDSLINSDKKVILKLKRILKQKNISDKKLYFRKGDVRNQKFLIKVFKEFKDKDMPIQSVIHFAGLKSVKESLCRPIEFWDNNVNSILNLLFVMQSFSCFEIIFSSSATIYQPRLSEKLNENSLCEPINAYGNTKLCIEKILSDVFKTNPDLWKIINLRYFNPLGAHESGLIGDNPKVNSDNIFPSLFNVINKRNKEFLIYGRDWPTHDGTCIRDYIHIMDLADAHFAAHQFLIKNCPQILNLNIGTGNGTSVLELIDKFKKINRCQIIYKFVNRRKGDTPYLVADNSLALRLLDWEPFRDIEKMCEDSWNYFKKSS